MPLVVRDFDWGVGKVVDLLVLRMWRCIPGILGRLGSLFLGTPVTAFCFDRGPLVWGRCSSVGGRLMSSTVLEGDGFVLSGHRIICSRSRMGNSVCCLGRGSVGCGPSI